MSTLAVVPTFQEAENIAELLHRIRDAAPSVDVLVVDDGSPDGTADVAEAVAAELGRVDILRRSQKEGLRQAYHAGFIWGLEHDYDILVCMDADLSHDPSALPALLRAVDGGADIVLGSRYMPGGSIPDWPFRRRALSRWGNRYATAALGLGVADATSGYRAYRSTALREIDFQHVRANGYGFQIELLYRLSRHGRRVEEVPIAFVDRRAGESKISGRIVAEAFILVTAWAAKSWAQRLGSRLTGRSRADTL